MATRMQQRRGTQAQWTAANPILAAGEIGFETDTSKFKMGNGSSTWSALQYFANASELAAIVGGLSGIDLPASLDTLNELAAALGDDPQFFTTVTNSLALKAPLSSPTLTGTPTAPTADITTNTTQIATTAFVQSKVNQLIDAAPEALNTLNELAAAIGDDANFAATLTTSVGTKVAKAGDTMTGALTLPGAPTELLHAANKGYVDGAIDALDTTAEGYVNTHNAETLSVHGIANTANLATKTYADDAVAAQALLTTAEIGAHNLETLNVHGIANTQNLATLDDLSSSVSGVTEGYSTLGGVGIDWNPDTEKFDIDNTVATVSDITDHNSETLNVHGITNTASLATHTDVSDAVAAQALITTTEIGAHNTDETNVHGIADTSALATHTDVSDAVAAQALITTTEIGTHNTDTTNVHGIADTASLETTTGAQAKADAAASAAVSTHSDDTTSVHGIADTSALATKTYADDAVSTHNSDTTNVHGITDTAALATKTYADDAVTTAVGALTKSSVGLANVDNTSDANKPVSTATQTALDLKAPLADPTFTGTVSGVTKAHVGLGNVDNTSDADKPVSSATQTALDAKASLSGATFTGSVEIDQNLVVDGNLTVNGTAFNASSTSIVIEDNMVQLAHQNAANTVDLGLVVGYNDGAAKHSGIVRDVSADKWKLFKGVTTEPSTTVDFTEGSLDALQVAGLEATTLTVSSGVAFSDGTQAKEGVPSRTPIIAKTDSYTLSALTERDSLVEVAKATATTITIPTDATLNFPVGTSIDILQTSTGQVTIAGAAGVTVNATPGLKLRTTWSSATLFKRAANTWVVYGDLTA
jgi:hypothetical protein